MEVAASHAATADVKSAPVVAQGSDGAFYAYADVGHLTDDSMAWTKRLLAETGVAVTPGIDFDTEHGNRFVRFSFAADIAEVSAALDRIEDWIGATPAR